jgi:hypothetical protein
MDALERARQVLGQGVPFGIGPIAGIAQAAAGRCAAISGVHIEHPRASFGCLTMTHIRFSQPNSSALVRGLTALNHRAGTRYDTLRMRAVSLVGVAGGDGDDEGLREDSQIEREGPVFDVIQVVLDAPADLLDRVGFAAPAAHLRPSSDAGLHPVSGRVFRDRFTVELVGRLRP